MRETTVEVLVNTTPTIPPDLHIGDQETISVSPDGIGADGGLRLLTFDRTSHIHMDPQTGLRGEV